MPTATAAEHNRPDIPAAIARRIARWRVIASSPVSAESVAVARMCFGALAAVGAARVLWKGWVTTLYLAPQHHLAYPGFDWVRPWPPVLMHLHLVALVLLGAAIAVGYRTRVVALLWLAGFTYVELLDATLYLNHYWYLTCAGVLIAALPVAGHWSIDAWQGRVARTPYVPAWSVWAFRAQLAVVYVFAGLAKLNPDWLGRAQPLRLWLAEYTSWPVVGALMDEPVTAYVASWVAALFDLTIVGWLLWRRTRLPAWLVVVVFHVVTGLLFPIGLFPFVMVFGTLVFFAPDWPGRLLGRRATAVDTSRPTAHVPRSLRFVLALFAVVQLWLPVRHYGAEGNVRWNEDGYYLAWRVMLTEKAGYLEFLVTDPQTGRTWEVGPDAVLAEWQVVQAAIRPDLIRQTAELVDGLYEADVEVRAISFVSMNGRPAAPMVDPSVDLTAPRGRAWVLPAP